MSRVEERLRVTLLGRFRVRIGQRAIDDAAWRRRHARALLSALALAPDHRLHRDVLIERLWPEGSPERSARQLNKVLHIVRRALEPALARGSDSRYLRRRGETIALNCTDGIDVDVLAFETTARAVLAGTNALLDAIEDALALYGGELLGDERFDEDTEARRVALAELHRALLIRRAALLETDGRSADAVIAYRNALAQDACDERCHRALMRLYAGLGQRARALEQHALCVATLRDALGVEPEESTRELHEAIRSGRVELAPGASAPTAGREPMTLPSLAIMPFDNPGLDPEIDYLCEGLAENLIRRVALATGERILAWHTVAAYGRAGASPREIGRALGVSRVLLGRILARGTSLDVYVELVDTADGSLLWGERYAGERSEALLLLERMIGDIAARTGASGNGASPATARSGSGAVETDDVAAYHEYLKGRYHWNKRSGEALRAALDHFRGAIDIDPVYARAYSGLADSYSLLSLYSAAAPRETMPKARAAAGRALEIDPELCEAHTSLAYYLLSYEWRFGAAEASFRTALALNSDYPTAHQWYHKLLVAAGRFDEAEHRIETAKVLDPLSPMIAAEEAWGLYHSRRLDRAGTHVERVLEETPNFPIARYILALVRLQQDRLDEAREILAPVTERPSADPFVLAHGLYGHVLARGGDESAARDRLATLAGEGLAAGAAGYARALVHLGLDETGSALAALGDAFRERFDRLIFLPVDPLFDPLRTLPGFASLSRRPDDLGVAKTAPAEGSERPASARD